MKLVYSYYVGAAILLIIIAGVPAYYRVSGDIQVCRLYYKDMSVMACYFSSKTVRIPEQK